MKHDPTQIEMSMDPLIRRFRGTVRHGGHSFDVPFITKVTPTLWQGGCQEGMVLPMEVKHLVSLYPWERYQVNHEIYSELYFRMLDSLEQSMSQVDEIARYVNERQKTGVVLVHCQGGLNRSSLVVVRALMFKGMPAKDAIANLRFVRSPVCLCNSAFEKHLLNL